MKRPCCTVLSAFLFLMIGESCYCSNGAKYHSAGLWTNTCCSHPLPGEQTPNAASRRLQEEMGFKATLIKAFDFIYKAPFDNGLTEYEFDHVFIGKHNDEVNADPTEVNDHKYLSMVEIRSAIADQPSQFTAWFKIAFPKVEEYLASQTGN